MTSSQNTLVGQTLKDRYLVQKPLGAGGMGSVYEGVDQDLARPIVVKVPHATLLSQPGFLTRFQKEIGSLLALEHKNVVRVLDAGTTENDLPYLVLQFLRGGNLEDRLPQKVASEEVLEWLPQIAEALDFVHARGYVHRDIKPANILFDDQGHPYVADFGITKALGDENTMVTAPGYTPGTPNYMAPEAESTQPLTGAYDQYALAVVVYQALSEAIPHQGTTPYEILNAKKTQKPVPLTKVAPHVPQEIARAVMVALEKEPHDRYPSCKAFALAFEEAHKQSVQQTGSRVSSRLLVAVAAVVLIGAGVFAWIAMSGGTEADEADDSGGPGQGALVAGLSGSAADTELTTGGGGPSAATDDGSAAPPLLQEPVGAGQGNPGSTGNAGNAGNTSNTGNAGNAGNAADGGSVEPTETVATVAAAIPWRELEDALEMAFEVDVDVALSGAANVDTEALVRQAHSAWARALLKQGLVVKENDEAELVLRATYALRANEAFGAWAGLGDGNLVLLSNGVRVAGLDDTVGPGDSRKANDVSAGAVATRVLGNLVSSNAEDLVVRELANTDILSRTVDVVLPAGVDAATVRRTLLKGEGFDVEDQQDGIAVTFRRGRLAELARFLSSMSFGDGRPLEIATWNETRGRLVLRLADA